VFFPFLVGSGDYLLGGDDGSSPSKRARADRVRLDALAANLGATKIRTRTEITSFTRPAGFDAGDLIITRFVWGGHTEDAVQLVNDFIDGETSPPEHSDTRLQTDGFDGSLAAPASAIIGSYLSLRNSGYQTTCLVDSTLAVVARCSCDPNVGDIATEVFVVADASRLTVGASSDLARTAVADRHAAYAAVRVGEPLDRWGYQSFLNRRFEFDERVQTLPWSPTPRGGFPYVLSEIVLPDDVEHFQIGNHRNTVKELDLTDQILTDPHTLKAARAELVAWCQLVERSS
jgi:hypothetical protein